MTLPPNMALGTKQLVVLYVIVWTVIALAMAATVGYGIGGTRPLFLGVFPPWLLVLGALAIVMLGSYVWMMRNLDDFVFQRTGVA